ncbi:MAG: Mov34/MPN/PAD-1 family protein [Candidatus Jordarchaeaceae archaeon]
MSRFFRRIKERNGLKEHEILKVRIRGEVVDGVLEACRNVYPHEFIGLLRAEEGVITEIILPPASVYGKGLAEFRPHMLPFDLSIVGSIHSHPSGSGEPSTQDLNSMFNFGLVHIIVTFPYTSYQDLHVYDKKGKPLELEIVK